MRALSAACIAFIGVLSVPALAAAQEKPESPCVARPDLLCSSASTQAIAPARAVEEEAPPKGSAFGRFVKDVGTDYRRFFSQETGSWYAAGLVASGAVFLADEEIREAFEDPPSATQTALEGGDHYGNVTWQVPLALGWWVTGHAMGSSRAADAGRDLVRAQISAATWAYVIKYAVSRTRPNGDPRSFPSGHSTATFATAMVLQQHYGWKVGVPFFAAATYTAISRLTVNKHWASDVTFGAFVGMASARTVTLHVRGRRFAVVPSAAPGGAGVTVTLVRRSDGA